ncbi:MAG: hypothetical protein JSS87_06275 [Acidobacteria bacterium]|nr:hypothetical protein [Acidobacteriota bacterium]
MFRCLAVSSALILTSASLSSQMVSPTIDRPDKPFSYFSKPTDQIGVAGAPTATEITPEGFLYTSNGELVFGVGPEYKLLETNDGPRIRTLEEGYLPIENFDVERDGLIYHFQMFAASMGKQPEGAVANFVRVRIENPTHEERAAFLAAGFRYSGGGVGSTAQGENRFRRPVTGAVPGAYNQPGETWSAAWTYGFSGNAATRNGKVVYLFDTTHKPVVAGTLLRNYNSRPAKFTKERKLNVDSTNPVDAITYAFPVAAGKTETIEFKMPLIPAAKDSDDIKAIQAAKYDDYHDRVVKYWRERVAEGMQIMVPEEKANNLFRTCLVNDLLALNHIGNDWIQTVNQTHYHSFYLRDSSDFVRMYDVTGYPKTAENVLNFFGVKQQPDGNFLSQKGEFDGWGQTLWIYGYHVRFTQDRAFAEKIYPSVLRAIDWFEKATAADPLHIMPSTDVKDNEFVPGHLTGYNFLALDGLQGAIALADTLGKKEDAARFQHDYDTLRENFMKVLKQRSAEADGTIPPALDPRAAWNGTDWGNLLSIVPEPQLDPQDPMVTATLKSSQSRYAEGLTVYERPDQGAFLHHYLIMKNTMTELARGDQEQAMREFYALLLHTSSTNSGFEYAIRPWGNRDFQGNLAPHGWFAAEFRNTFRNMMLREENDNTLHLLSAISPDWVGGSKKIEVSNAPTMFGAVNMELVSTGDNSAELRLKTNYTKHAPKKVIVHVPWFMDVQGITVDGKKLTPSNVAFEIPANAKLVKFTWTRRNNAPEMSFDKSVEDYKTEYAKRYAEYLKTGHLYAQ